MRPGPLAILFTIPALLAGCASPSLAGDGAAPPPTLTIAPTVPASPVPATGAWYTTASPPYEDGPDTPQTPYSTVTDTACPPEGLTYTVGFTDAAMGLRFTGLTVRNCGSATRTVKGYPDLTVVDEFQRPADVTVKHGEAGSDGTPLTRPRSFRLKPGQALSSALTWRNTITVTEEDRSVKAGGVLLRSGTLKQVFMAYLDIGSSGDVYVSPWALPTAD